MVSNQIKLLNEKEKFEALFQFASLGILIINQEGEIILANNFLLNQFDYKDVDDILGKKVEVLIPKSFNHNHVGYRTNYTAHPQQRPMGLGIDLFAVKKSGSEFPVEVSLSNYKNEEANFTIAFVNDISRRKEIEKAVLLQQKELEEINLKIEELNNELEQKVVLRTIQLEQAMTQLEASKEELVQTLSKEKELSDLKSRFVSMASHEFRTPLSTILSSASLVAKYIKEEEQDKRDKHILRIKSAVHNLTDILNEFLSLGKIEDGKLITNLSRFNIKELLTNICNEIQGIAKKGQHISYTHKGNTEVELDMTLMRNIFINLLSNAIKFSPENCQIKMSSNADENGILFKVQDCGIGISTEDLDHLFERFFRGKNVVNIQGTGLGLHIVGKYVELMDGHITCESELEKGTVFIITFKNNNENLL